MNTLATLLLTDVVDSTKLLETLGNARMADVWSAHDRVARDLLAAFRGREIDRADGFLLLFASPADAVSYALAYHRALAALDPPLRARAGLHVGAVILRENTPADVARGAKPLEVEGLAKPTAARIMSLASGGQTLLSDAARVALGETSLLVGETSLLVRSHGHWRMKGLDEPIELFEVGEAGAPFTTPADTAKVYRVTWSDGLWLPARDVPHRLPAERDGFVGRHADLIELADRLDRGARLVTLLGTGGKGKTRLMTRFARLHLGDYPGGAWFCDLSEAQSVDDILRAVAAALDVPLGKDDPILQLGHAIASRGPCLLVLDNFEQVVPHAAATLERWLDRAPDARFVVTSRVVLGLPGEQVFALAPLPITDAVELFVARAISAKRDFVLSPEERPHAEALVELLDGLPLAIELAAARIRLMTLPMLRQRVGERFKLLTSSGSRHGRPATLRATIDWSWDLLSEAERAALAQLSVFEGGFSLESIEAVVCVQDAWPSDLVQALLDKSLVRRVRDDRFDLLISVHEYAREKLAESSEQRGAEQRHGAHFAGMRDAAAGVDLDNMVAACRRAVLRGDAELAVAALEGAWEVLEFTGPPSAGLELAALVAVLPDLSPGSRGRARAVSARALTAVGRQAEARPRFEAALELLHEAGDARAEARTLAALGDLEARERIDGAEERLRRALALAREVGDRRSEGVALRHIGNNAYFLGHFAEAQAQYSAAADVARAAGDRQNEGASLANMGLVHNAQGRLEEARHFFEAGLKLNREVGDRRAEANALGNIGIVLRTQGRLQEAGDCHAAALRLLREAGDRPSEATQLANLAEVRLESGDFVAPLALLQEAIAIARDVGERSAEGFAGHVLATLHLRCGRIAEAREELLAAERVLRAARDRWEVANLLLVRVEVEARAGCHAEARAAWDEAEAIARELDSGPTSDLGRGLARTAALLEASEQAE